MKQTIDLTVAAIVLESVGGLILLRIFKKIYIVIKDRDECNAYEELDYRDTSFVPKTSLNDGLRPSEI
jgi:hypothetical protein